MQKRNQFDNSAIDLAEESFNNVRPYSVESALARGIIVEVTEWVMPEIGFGKNCFRSRVVLTARLWDTLLQAYVRRRNGEADSLWYKRNDVLWLAAQALRRADGARCDAANFRMQLPVMDERACITLRVERIEREDRKLCEVTIGFAEDFMRL